MPVTIDTTVETADGVALVGVRVDNDEPVARRVRLRNRLDGPVLPPRRHGLPEPGWSDDGYAGVVDAGAELALGYACVTDPDPGADCSPVELVSVGDPADGTPDPMDRVVSDLPDATPPAAVIPSRTGTGGGSPTDRRRPSGSTGSKPDRPDPSADADDASRPAGERASPDALPPAVRRYLDGAETRVGRAETLAEGSFAEATATLESGVAPAGIAALVAADAEALSALADRATELSSRATDVDVPVEAMERLA
ncbi:hypothetical protein [Halobaculum sp. EA56]|uniref:DUF7857 domain-containing protein n=1 Tax=Halobaculum sp. EA56 TaxID=3421648 RepID=UPI003EC0F096